MRVTTKKQGGNSGTAKSEQSIIPWTLAGENGPQLLPLLCERVFGMLLYHRIQQLAEVLIVCIFRIRQICACMEVLIMSAIGLEESFHSLRKLLPDFGDAFLHIKAFGGQFGFIFTQHRDDATHLCLDIFQFFQVVKHVYSQSWRCANAEIEKIGQRGGVFRQILPGGGIRCPIKPSHA